MEESGNRDFNVMFLKDLEAVIIFLSVVQQLVQPVQKLHAVAMQKDEDLSAKEK
jgi:hypothetical protein